MVFVEQSVYTEYKTYLANKKTIPDNFNYAFVDDIRVFHFISRLEQGESVQVDNLFKILLALELGDNIELLVPDQTKRPSFYLEKTADKPKRVRKKIEKSESEFYEKIEKIISEKII